MFLARVTSCALGLLIASCGAIEDRFPEKLAAASDAEAKQDAFPPKTGPLLKHIPCLLGQIAANASHVFVTATCGVKNSTGGISGRVELLRVSKSGDGSSTIAALPLTSGDGSYEGPIALSNTDAFWLIQDQLYAVPYNPGSIRLLAAAAMNHTALAMSGSILYYSNGPDLNAVSVTGGDPTTIVTGAPAAAIAVVDSTVFWVGIDCGVYKTNSDRTVHTLSQPASNCLADGSGIAVLNGFVYWSDRGAVRRVPVGGGHSESVFSGPGAMSVSPFESKLYWLDFATKLGSANSSDNSVMTLSSNGTQPTAFWHQGGEHVIRSFVVQPNVLYVATTLSQSNFPYYDSQLYTSAL